VNTPGHLLAIALLFWIPDAAVHGQEQSLGTLQKNLKFLQNLKQDTRGHKDRIRFYFGRYVFGCGLEKEARYRLFLEATGGLVLDVEDGIKDDLDRQLRVELKKMQQEVCGFLGRQRDPGKILGPYCDEVFGLVHVDSLIRAGEFQDAWAGIRLWGRMGGKEKLRKEAVDHLLHCWITNIDVHQLHGMFMNLEARDELVALAAGENRRWFEDLVVRCKTAIGDRNHSIADTCRACLCAEEVIGFLCGSCREDVLERVAGESRVYLLCPDVKSIRMARAKWKKLNYREAVFRAIHNGKDMARLGRRLVPEKIHGIEILAAGEGEKGKRFRVYFPLQLLRRNSLPGVKAPSHLPSSCNALMAEDLVILVDKAPLDSAVMAGIDVESIHHEDRERFTKIKRQLRAYLFVETGEGCGVQKDVDFTMKCRSLQRMVAHKYSVTEILEPFDFFPTWIYVDTTDLDPVFKGAIPEELLFHRRSGGVREYRVRRWWKIRLKDRKQP